MEFYFNSLFFFFEFLLNILFINLMNVLKFKLNDDCCFVLLSILFIIGNVNFL